MNDLQKLLLKYPNKSWDWTSVSANPNIDMEFIETHPELPWNWGCVLKNQNLMIGFDLFLQILSRPMKYHPSGLFFQRILI